MTTLQQVREHVKTPLAQSILDRMIAEPETAAIILLENFAILGAQEEWDGGDFLDDFSQDANRFLPASIGDQSPEELAAWREIALVFGYGPDELGYEEEEEEE